ncbi:MAG: ribosomal RNA small subunit methyltransferase A [Deltaproteobacteria bacterium]|nr:ribosomal RNA small subunit methyltransferase A [Deltaproteobacteria bacterium]
MTGRQRAKRSLGQNFLVDQTVIRRIVEAAGVIAGETVVEIGPGRGALTSQLRARADRFVCIEKDDSLAAEHAAHFADDDGVSVVHGDALKVLPAELPFDAPYRVVANLPYNMAARITLHLLENWGNDLSSLTLMFQAEVADRIVGQPNTKAYGSLSVQVANFCEGWRLFSVPGGAFRPVPKVLSAVVRLRRRPTTLCEDQGVDYQWLRKVARAGFQSRRKTLVNSLKLAPTVTSDPATLHAALATAGIAEGVRADAVTPTQFVALAAALEPVE